MPTMRRFLLVVLPLLAVTGCAGDNATKARDENAKATTSANPSPTATTPRPGTSDATASGTPSGARVRTITLAIKNGKVEPEFHRERIKVGEKVTLNITSDVNDELHIHGADVEKALRAGQQTSVSFTIKPPGVWLAEAHHSGLELLQLEVR